MSNVLIVDDDRRVRELLATWLKAGGYSVHEAEDAKAGLALLSQQDVAVAMIDKDMPGQPGTWLVEQIQQSHPAVAMLLATGDDSIPPRISLSRGIQGYLVKPFKRELVLQAVKEAALWHTSAVNQAPQAGAPDPIESWLQGRAGRTPKQE
jgi:DNA-binding NtrC family response regulator